MFCTFPEYMFYICFVKFIPTYFILFDTIINRIIFFISLWILANIYIYIAVIDFYYIDLISCNLLNLCILIVF